ncbi:hypothetical protein AND_002699 [Anopheles darlingi]|uniref:Uncharacterized protein n=1 Tax=Anopheles darlingi TaxID=43151 RepID=W5JQE0_ANODA|nr:hypothetical protein AND_002699 [Anopheles darlingi]
MLDPDNKRRIQSKEYRISDCYPRVLEHIISTQPPQVLCRDYKEILGTLDIISTDPEPHPQLARKMSRKFLRESEPEREPKKERMKLHLRVLKITLGWIFGYREEGKATTEGQK